MAAIVNIVGKCCAVKNPPGESSESTHSKVTDPAESLSFEDHVTIIQQGLRTFVAVGRSLQEIREKRLYKASHKTFEAFCRDRLGLSRAHAYRLIDARSMNEILSPTGDVSERHIRAMAPLLKANADAGLSLWLRLEAEHGSTLTAEIVANEVAQYMDFLAHENAIDRWRVSENEVGPALARIRANKQYTEKYETFEEYCRLRWGLSLLDAEQVINAKTAGEVQDIFFSSDRV